MYHQQMMEKEAAKEAERSQFLYRLAGLPLSKAAMDHLSALYSKAQQQKVLAIGLKAGESTIKIAGMMAMPVINRLPVETLDGMACKQLDRLEGVVPSIKKEPKEILAASEELYIKAKALPSTTYQRVKDVSYNTVNGVKCYAFETVNPTIERVHKVKEYSTQKVTSATQYSKEKIDGVKHTYESVRSGELAKNCYDSVRGGVVHQYEGIKHGIAAKYEGVVSNVTGMRTSVVSKYEKARQELLHYTAQTLQPTRSRISAVKDYSTHKVHEGSTYISSTYTGIKDRTILMYDQIAHSQIMTSLQQNSLVQSLDRTVGGAIGYADSMLDNMIPPAKGEDSNGSPVDPAAPRNSLTKSMMLMSKLRDRLYQAGQQRLKPYTTRACEMADQMTVYTKQSTNYVVDTYTATTSHITQIYNNRLAWFTGHNTKENGATTHEGSHTQWLYGNMKENIHSKYDKTCIYTMNLWNTGTKSMGSLYGYVYETLSFATDTVSNALPIQNWLRGGHQEELDTDETCVMRPESMSD